MKNIVGILCLIFLINCASTNIYVKDQNRLNKIKKIAVLPFSCTKREIGYNIASSLASRLVASRFQIIERTQLKNILQEHGLSMSGVIEDYSIAIGKIKGIDAIIVGEVTMSTGWAGLAFGGNIEYISNCSIRMIDIVTGEVILGTNFTSETASTFSGVTTASEVGEKLAEKISQY